jgi:hypothetical protein
MDRSRSRSSPWRMAACSSASHPIAPVKLRLTHGSRLKVSLNETNKRNREKLFFKSLDHHPLLSVCILVPLLFILFIFWKKFISGL